MLSLCPFDISVGVWAFVIGLSQISSFFSLLDFSHQIPILLKFEKANSNNCGPSTSNKLDLEVGQRSRSSSPDVTNRKSLSQGSFIPNINALSLIRQKIWDSLKFLWQTDRRTNVFLCRGHSWRVRLAKQEMLTPPGHLVSSLFCRGPWMSTVVLYCWYHSDNASVLLYFTFLSHLFFLPCGAGSTVPSEGFDSSVIMPFSWCVVAVTLPI